ncbi:MAG TPA: hypothetical protein VKZ65_14700 [Glycomyces sp.]|nr:hypothetical protein [Glycomyces sp.]
MESEMAPREARAALEVVTDSRSEMAERLVTPWWYHPVLGILLGGFMAVLGVGVPTSVMLGLMVLYFGGIGVLAWAYRRLTGVWVNGFEVGPRSRRSATRLGATAIALALVGAVFGLGLDLAWVPVCCGVAIAVVTTVWGRRFDAILREELREPV